MRYLTVAKKGISMPEEWQYFGYIGLLGPAVDRAARKDSGRVPKEQIQQRYVFGLIYLLCRIKRDGPMNHITLLIGPEIDQLTKEIDKWKGNEGKLTLL